MNRYIWTFVLAGIVGMNSAKVAGVVVLRGPVHDSGHDYYLLAQSTWTDAEAQAASMNGHLATVNNAAENAFIVDTFGPTVDGYSRASLWIGLNDIDNEGQFVWVSGESVAYTNWWSGEPSSGPDEDVVGIDVNLLGSPGAWHDIYADGSTSSDTVFGVVEIVPEPADANGDGKVDIYDLATLANHYELPGQWSWAHADFNGDHSVNVYDLAILANHYGYTAGRLGDSPVASGGDAVPEPASLALLGLGALAALRRRPKQAAD